jgi:hypothetical protein
MPDVSSCTVVIIIIIIYIIIIIIIIIIILVLETRLGCVKQHVALVLLL